MSTEAKLSPHTTWLFAFGAVVAGIGLSFALSGLGQKVTAAVYFAVVAIGGFASTYLTRATVRGAVLSFVTAGLVAAVAYYLLVSHVVASATTTLGTAASGGAAASEAAKAGGTFGAVFGVVAAVVVLVESLVAGIGGAIAGNKVRAQGGLASLGSLDAR
jgi:hypothetical protein